MNDKKHSAKERQQGNPHRAKRLEALAARTMSPCGSRKRQSRHGRR